MVISRSVLRKMRNILTKCFREIQNTRFLFKNFFFENRAVCEIMWEKYGGARQAIDDNIMWDMRIACWINKATAAHSACDIRIASSG